MRTGERPDRELMALGKSLQGAREAKAMTPAELAHAASVEQSDLEALEAGRFAPPGDVLLALSDSLGLKEAFGSYMDITAILAVFSDRLRTLREDAGLSQEALGRLAGLHRTAIHKFEKGETDPRLTSIRRLARGLQVPPRALIEEDADVG